jgi:hypothetical protein
MKSCGLPSIVGSILIFFSMALLSLQALAYLGARSAPDDPICNADIGLSHWMTQTPYPGVITICVGALLLLAGSFTKRPES